MKTNDCNLLVYNLVHNIDVENTNRLIREYQQKNMEQIAKSKIRQAMEERKQLEEKKVVEQEQEIQQTVQQEQVEKPSDGSYVPQQSFRVQPAPLTTGPVRREQSEQEYGLLLFLVLIYSNSVQLKITRAKAGGFDQTFIMQRAFEEAFSTVYPVKEIQ